MLKFVILLIILVNESNGFHHPSSVSLSTTSYTTTKLHAAKIPEITNWQISAAGEAKGIIKYHPVLDDGDIITTSRLVNTELCAEGSIVCTASGSKYKLEKPSSQQLKLLEKKRKQEEKLEKVAAASQKQQKTPTNASKSSSSPSFGFFNKKSVKESEVAPSKPNQTKSAQSQVKAGTYRGIVLSASTVGNGKYVLAKKSFRSTSGKSTIYTAFQTGKDGLPTGERLAVKVSPNTDALKREYSNYLKIQKGFFNGRFVNCNDFYATITDNNKQFKEQSALVIDGGVKNLKQFLDSRWGQGLKGRAMRDVAATAGQCTQAMHSSKLVWTDLKTENFVIMEDEDGASGLKCVKGIDLESARPYGRNPVDYSPEACPPEFADAFVSGYGAEFILKPSYDMWSLGMMLYELSTGKPYFGTKSSLAITKILRAEGFTANVSKVKDKKLRDLIEQCLSINPDKRPDINQYLLHPFFTTTGIGPFSF